MKQKPSGQREIVGILLIASLGLAFALLFWSQRQSEKRPAVDVVTEVVSWTAIPTAAHAESATPATTDSMTAMPAATAIEETLPPAHLATLTSTTVIDAEGWEADVFATSLDMQGRGFRGDTIAQVKIPRRGQIWLRSWSPDGRYIVYTHTLRGERNHNTYLLDTTTSSRQLLSSYAFDGSGWR